LTRVAWPAPREGGADGDGMNLQAGVCAVAYVGKTETPSQEPALCTDLCTRCGGTDRDGGDAERSTRMRPATLSRSAP
jgi:hypothetical protein